MRIHPDVERLALLGWRVVPATATKKGLFKGYIEAATSDLDTIDRWSYEYPRCNWKVIPSGSGVWAIDIDAAGAEHANDGTANFRRLVEQHSPLPAKPHGRSPSGGHLLVFKDTGAAIKCASGHPAPGIDPRAGRNAFTVSPSRGVNGIAYRWLQAPWDINPPAAPSWLLALLAPPPVPARSVAPIIHCTDRARRTLCRAVEAISMAGEGGRNDTLNRRAYPVARYVAAGLLPEVEAIQALYQAAEQIGLPHSEIKATIQSAFRSGFQNPWEIKQ